MGVVGFGAAAPAAFVAALLRTTDSTLPVGLYIGGVDVGGMSPAEAVALLNVRWKDYLANPVTFELDDRVWRPSGLEVGLRMDYRSVLRRVVEVQGGGGIVQRISGRSAPVNTTVNIAVFEPAVLREYISGIAQGFDQPAVNATVDHIDYRAAVLRPGQIGRVIDVEAAVQAVGDLTQPSDPIRVVALTFRQELPVTSTEEAAEAIDQLARNTGAPVWLMHNGSGWTLSPEDLRSAAQVNVEHGNMRPTLDFAQLGNVFASIEKALASEARPTVFEYDKTQDRVLAFEPGNAGQRINRPALEAEMARAFESTNDRVVEIPLIVLNKEFDFSRNALGITDLLATGDSLYRESPDYRMHNIAVGAENLNGHVVRPGDTFSFLERIGPFRLSAGWVEGSIIVADKTEQGVGGGICQVSTTLFRAVLNAGLEIVERWPHLYRVRYYEMGPAPIGIDATVFSPGVDLKFRNDTNHRIMLRSLVDTQLGSLEFQIWGVNDGRRAEIVDHELWDWKDPPPDEGIVDPTEDPGFEEQVEWAKRGVQASFSRIIRRPDGSESISTFRSSFQPWPNRFVVGIDEAKARFPNAYNKWFDDNAEDASRWGVSRVPGVPGDPDAPSG